MTLTLGNDLTGLVSREVAAAESKTRGLGTSLTTGNDVFVEVVDAFLGNSLRDGEILLGAIAKNTAYGVNLLTVTDEYLKTIASLLQDSLKIISSAGSLSTDKLAVLQKSLRTKKAQVNLLINTASFDSKSLLKGDIDMDVQVGLNVTDKLRIKVNDISKGKLFRSSIANTINRWIAEDYTRCRYYNSQSEMNQDLARNLSLVDAAGMNKGSGTGANPLTRREVATAISSLRDGNPSFLSLLNETLPQTISALKAMNCDFTNATIDQLSNAMARGNPALAGAKIEVINLLYDNSLINFFSVYGAAEIVFAKNIYTTALATIRSEQASIANQKQNLLSLADGLRATTNVTQKAANSYLRADYVLTAQQYSETIRSLSVKTLHGSINKGFYVINGLQNP